MTSSFARLLFAAFAVGASVAVTLGEQLDVKIDSTTGSFKITLGGSSWLSGGSEYRVGSKSLSEGSLALIGSSESEGSDVHGAYTSTALKWAAVGDEKKVLMETRFRKYTLDSGLVVFEQYFPAELDMKALSAGMVGSSLKASTLFPTFARSSPTPLSCFAYHNTFPTMEACTLATYKETELGGSPLVIYDASNKSLPMTVFSPLNEPMAHHMASSDSFFGAGVKSQVETIPAGWSQMFMLSAATGINDGMMAWGDRLLKSTGRPRVDNRYLDESHGSIGFWTDNGGYYHYNIGNNASLGKNYEEVLPKVKAYHDELGVPFKHWQFDSWFYPKDGGVNAGGGGGAVTNWTALDSVFPHGMAYIQSLIGLPTIMHNRQWSNISDYIHNWTDIEWYMSNGAAVPKDPVRFFDRFFTQQEGWGLSMYEQDWMVTEYKLVEALHTNITMGDLWLYGMAEGAARSKRTVQYCMPLPYEVLSAASLPAVTNARATGDYFHAKNQWAVGQTALFYWALNILPFKDGFYSSSQKQVGGQTEGPEQDPDREALMATLSAAMVGPMDGIYLLNASRVMTTCRGDGKVLKPDRPITPPDECFRTGRPTCQVYQTYSDVKGLGRVHYYFNNDGSAPMKAVEVDLEADAGKGTYALYNWYTGELSLLAESNSLVAGYEGHIYATAAPVVGDWAFVGEVNKYVVGASIRFKSVAATAGALSVSVVGVRGETLKVCAAEVKDLALVCKSVAFKEDGVQNVSFESAGQQVLV